MSNKKRAYIVVFSVLKDNEIHSQWSAFKYSRNEAKAALKAFAAKCQGIKPEEVNLADWRESIGGVCAEPFHGDAYSAHFAKVVIEVDELEDNEDTFKVELRFTRTYLHTVEVVSEDEETACEEASDNAESGEYDDDIDWHYPDESEVDVLDSFMVGD